MPILGYEIFHFVTDGLLFITLIASICFTICSTVRLRRRRDPARRVFSWVKIAWLIFTLAVFTSLLELATITVTSRVYQNAFYSTGSSEYGSVDFVARLASGAGSLAILLNIFAELLVYLTLASMIRCIRLVGTADEKHPRRHRWARYATYGVSFAITILSLAVFSVALYYIVLTEISSSVNGIAWDRYYNSYLFSSFIMALTCQAALFVFSLSMLIRSCILRRKLRAKKSLRKPFRYLIACCSLWVLRASFDIYATVFDIVVPGYFRASTDNGSSFNEILSVVFMTWPVFIILIILYYLGLDSKTGLSSTGSPLLTQDTESQAASAEFLSEQPTVTPMTERENAPTLTPITQQTESLFGWDGVVDAPPEYSPPAEQQPAVPRTTVAPIIRRPLPASASPLAELVVRRSNELSETSSGQPGSAMQRPGASSPTTGAPQLPIERSSLEQHDIPDSVPAEEEAMGLYHQADGRAPASEPSSALPSHDETMGLYHQADGRSPISLTDLPNELPSHEETMGLYHQADGRPPGSSSVVPRDNADAAMFQASAEDLTSQNAPPSHDEAMGLYHQADGRAPESEPALYSESEKKKKN